MSTKTMKQRIALVAVSALTVGLLSVTSTPVANATANAAVGDANAATATGLLNVATLGSITGDATTSVTIADQKSVGLLATSTTLDTVSLTSTATMRSDGEVVFYYTGATQDAATSFEVVGGTITDSTVTGTTGFKNLNDSRTRLVAVDITVPLVASFAVTPNSGVTSMTVSAYDATATSVTNEATSLTQMASIQSGATSKGTLKQRYNVTVAATSVSGTWSSADSFIQGQSCSSLAAPTTNVETSSSHLKISNSATSVACISIDLRDAYNVSLTGKGALIVSGTNGAGIAYDTGYNASSTINNLTDVDTDTNGTITVARPAAFVIPK